MVTMVEVADFHSYGDMSFLFPKGGAVGRQALPSLDKRVLFGEDAIVPLDPVQYQAGNHLPVRGGILRAYTPAEVGPDGVFDPSLDLFLVPSRCLSMSCSPATSRTMVIGLG